MRKVNLADDFKICLSANCQRRGRPFADAVERQYRCFAKRRREKRAGRVTQMVFAEQQARIPVNILVVSVQLFAQQIPEIEFLAQPDRDRHAEGLETTRRECHVGFEQPLEFQERFVVERNVLDARSIDAGLFQTVGDGFLRKSRVVFFAREAFFLRGCDDLSVAQQCCGTVVIKGGNPEDIHRWRVRTAYR